MTLHTSGSASGYGRFNTSESNRDSRIAADLGLSAFTKSQTPAIHFCSYARRMRENVEMNFIRQIRYRMGKARTNTSFRSRSGKCRTAGDTHFRSLEQGFKNTTNRNLSCRTNFLGLPHCSFLALSRIKTLSAPTKAKFYDLYIVSIT